MTPPILTCSLILLVLSGCGPLPNREQLAKEVLREDPEFASVLDKQRTLSNRITTYERELALKRGTIEHTMAQLRRELASATANAKGKIAEVKKQMEPDRRRMALALSMAGEELRAKRFQRSSLARSIAQLRKAGSAPPAGSAGADSAAQQAQREELARDAKRLDQEITAIAAHMRLLKIKILLIRL